MLNECDQPLPSFHKLEPVRKFHPSIGDGLCAGLFTQAASERRIAGRDPQQRH